MNGTETIRAYFASSRAPIYFLNTISFNLLGADRWLGGLKFISAVDSFDGKHENAFTAPLDETAAIGDIEGVTRALLAHPAVAAYVEPGAKALFLMFDESAEALARGLSLQVCLPSAALRHQLDSKLTTTRLADRAGVRSAPNVIARIASYDELRCIARRLGEELVIQLPYGDSGSTTFFVSSERDFATYAARIAAEPEVKVMQRIHCRSLTIEGCVTRHGVLVGALQTELVGFSELTPFRGGWCGNEVFAQGESCILNQDVRQQAQRATQAIGQQLSSLGYRGCFGLDFLLDLDTSTLYLGELNPRITGASPMTNEALLDAGEVPLLLFHLLEWLDVAYEIDVEVFNRKSALPTLPCGWCQMIIEHIGDGPEVAHQLPRTGIWRMSAAGEIDFVGSEFEPSALRGEHDALFFRTIDAGRTVRSGTGIGRVMLHGRLMTDDYALTECARSWIRAFRSRISLRPR